MAYELHIERSEGDPVTVQEWRAAVAATEGVRLFEGSTHSITNPFTEERINLGASSGGDVEVFFPAEDQWFLTMRWSRASAAFKAQHAFDSSSPTWRVVATMARRLGAVIRGDEGENYDFETGKMS